MINVAVNWEEGELKNALVFNIANHMKKCFLNWNKDTVQDEVILNHLLELSDNKLKVSEEDLPLTDTSEFLKIVLKTAMVLKTITNKGIKETVVVKDINSQL